MNPEVFEARLQSVNQKLLYEQERAACTVESCARDSAYSAFMLYSGREVGMSSRDLAISQRRIVESVIRSAEAVIKPLRANASCMRELLRDLDAELASGNPAAEAAADCDAQETSCEAALNDVQRIGTAFLGRLQMLKATDPGAAENADAMTEIVKFLMQTATDMTEDHA